MLFSVLSTKCFRGSFLHDYTSGEILKLKTT